MTNKHKYILRDAVENVLLSLPLSHIAQINCCSRQYVHKLCSSYGMKVDRNNGTLTMSISTLKQLKKVNDYDC